MAQVRSLTEYAEDTELSADLVIVGGGACGLTLARALAGSGRDILILESGERSETPEHEVLNRVEMAPGCWSAAEAVQRDAYHRNLTRFWDGAHQAYGVRCRGLGGSTQAWAGKSAPFDAVDHAARDWVPLSGWPFGPEELAPWLARAADVLNLGPDCHDAAFWQRSGRAPPSPPLDTGDFRAMFWQFARSRRTPSDIMRIGADWLADPPDGIRVLTGATVVRIRTNDTASHFEGLEVRTLNGRRAEIRARSCVLAASAIENARLLLASDDVMPQGLGNGHDRVGRCLTDHPTATVARAAPGQVADLAARFGLFGLREGGQTFVYMHGLALSEAHQRARGLLNGAVFTTEERAPDDPFAAMRRLARRNSKAPVQDVLSVARSPLRLARGVAARAMARGQVPRPVAKAATDIALRFFPNTVARDFQEGRMPLKLSGLRFEATTEQPPDPENRVTLSEARDPLGCRVPLVHWRAGDAARANLLEIGRSLIDAFDKAGLPPLLPERWVAEGAPEDAVTVDLGHPMGTTRMSEDVKSGVVDSDCAVHGVAGLYVAGGSVLPTSGHANPTLMMLALTLRLGDRLRR